jgi:hypothetical protein
MSVSLTPRWIELPVREDRRQRHVGVRGGRDGARAPGAGRERCGPAPLRPELRALVDQLRARADGPGWQIGAAWALVADADLLPVTVVEAALHLMEDGCSLDGFVEQAIAAPSRASPRRT